MSKKKTPKTAAPKNPPAPKNPDAPKKGKGKSPSKSRLDLVKPGGDAAAVLALEAPVDRERAKKYDARLRVLVRDMSRSFIQFLTIVKAVVTERLYTALDYADAPTYFEERIGYSWRTIRRRLAILEALERIKDPSERDEVQKELEALGVHRAAVLAPVIGQEGIRWRQLLKRAVKVDEGALQAEVSRLLGSKARGLTEGDKTETRTVHEESRWLRYTINRLVDDGARAEVRNVFSAGRVAWDTDSDLAVLLGLVREAKVELYHEAQAKGWVPPVAESGDHVNEPQPGEAEAETEGAAAGAAS